MKARERASRILNHLPEVPVENIVALYRGAQAYHYGERG
jgi:hypothetical protein